MAIEVRTFLVPKTCECEVKYYIEVEGLYDLHFSSSPSYIWENKYFDTREEAEKCLSKIDTTNYYATFDIKEKITPLK